MAVRRRAWRDGCSNEWMYAKLEAGYGRPIMSSFHALFSVGTDWGCQHLFCRPAGIGLLPHMLAAAVVGATLPLAWWQRAVT